jgi:hypothetical protein
LSHTLLILKIYTTFKDVQMILKRFYDISTGFRFSKNQYECSVHSCSCPWASLLAMVPWEMKTMFSCEHHLRPCAAMCPKLYIPSSLNTDLMFWHLQWDVKSWFKSWLIFFTFQLFGIELKNQD